MLIAHRKTPRLASAQPRLASSARSIADCERHLASNCDHVVPAIAEEAENAPVEQTWRQPPVLRPRVELDINIDRALQTLDPPQQLVIGPQFPSLLCLGGDWHQVGQASHAAGGTERRFEYCAITDVTA